MLKFSRSQISTNANASAHTISFCIKTVIYSEIFDSRSITNVIVVDSIYWFTGWYTYYLYLHRKNRASCFCCKLGWWNVRGMSYGTSLMTCVLPRERKVFSRSVFRTQSRNTAADSGLCGTYILTLKGRRFRWFGANEEIWAQFSSKTAGVHNYNRYWKNSYVVYGMVSVAVDRNLVET